MYSSSQNFPTTRKLESKIGAAAESAFVELRMEYNSSTKEDYIEIYLNETQGQSKRVKIAERELQNWFNKLSIDNQFIIYYAWRGEMLEVAFGKDFDILNLTEKETK